MASDRPDTSSNRIFIGFILFTAALLLGLGYALFPHREPTAGPAVSGSGPSSPGTDPTTAPQKK
jgi:hypothetical protein